MQSTPGERLQQFSHLLQSVLFDRLEQELGPLSEKARLLVSVLVMITLSRHVAPRRGWRGRPSKDRQALASAFLAKSIYGLETTRQVREHLATDRQLRCLCGWNSVPQIPHESTFSRALAEFADSELPQRRLGSTDLRSRFFEPCHPQASRRMLENFPLGRASLSPLFSRHNATSPAKIPSSFSNFARRSQKSPKKYSPCF